MPHGKNVRSICLTSSEAPPWQALDRLGHATSLIARWTPGEADRSLRRCVDDAFERTVQASEADALPDGAHFFVVAGAVPAPLVAPSASAGLAEGLTAARNAVARHSHAVNRWLASRLFGTWIAYQASSLTAIVRVLRAALDTLVMELTRTANQPIDRQAMLEAVRRSDYLIVHLANSQRLASRLSDPCLSSTASCDTSRSTRVPTKRPRACPSTPGQLVLLRLLADELRELGLADVELDENGYLMATIRDHDRCAACPTIGFIAHVDTSPEMQRRGREADRARAVGRPRHRAARRSVRGPAAVREARARRADRPRHRHGVGHDAARRGRQGGRRGDRGRGGIPHRASGDPARPDPDRLHAGRGDRARRRTTSTSRGSAPCAPTRWTAARRGELEIESFSADAMTVTFIGFNTHPGYAKGRMVNAIKAAARFIDRLPHDRLSPETTDGYEGYVHPYQVEASRRSHGGARADPGLRHGRARARRKRMVERIARSRGGRAPARASSSRSQESYRNMREVLDRHPEVVERARDGDPARRPRADRAADPRRHRRLAAVVHGPADAEPLRRRAQLPLAPRVDVASRTWRRRSRSSCSWRASGPMTLSTLLGGLCSAC